VCGGHFVERKDFRMSLIRAAAIAGAGLILAAVPAAAGPIAPASMPWVKPGLDVVQVQDAGDAIAGAIIGGAVAGLVGGALGGGCYYNDCGDDDGYYGGYRGYGGYGGYGGWRGGGWHGGRGGWHGGGRVAAGHAGGGHMAGGPRR
jgi:hypothetical protein